ncbi:MAG: LytTR family DNA-binding domain-containing protein [Gammaproteobacteria bacterium]|nr:LytTR family DNA-binding domain-containing protein [Gammaproteobacteria bacterium]
MHSRDANHAGGGNSQTSFVGGQAARPAGHVLHFVVFFLLVPFGFAAWATAIGMTPAPLLGFGPGFVYIASQVLVAWWINGLVAGWLTGVLRDYRPRVWQILCAAFWIAWLPLIVFYYGHASFFASIFPELAADAAIQPFSWGYLLELLRYSLPFLPVWIAAVYGYNLITGVGWFDTNHIVGAPAGEATPLVTEQVAGAAAEQAAPPAVNMVGAEGAAATATVPTFMKHSRLKPDSALLAVKADEHYIHIWNCNESDMLRYRFRDALEELDSNIGAQVHRSWWVRWDAINQCRRKGRSLRLTLSNGLRVPVSLAHKAAVLEAIKRRSNV